jgi:hypothetical protein
MERKDQPERENIVKETGEAIPQQEEEKEKSEQLPVDRDDSEFIKITREHDPNKKAVMKSQLLKKMFLEARKDDKKK